MSEGKPVVSRIVDPVAVSRMNGFPSRVRDGVSRGRFMSEPFCSIATEQPSADPLPEPIRLGW